MTDERREKKGVGLWINGRNFGRVDMPERYGFGVISLLWVGAIFDASGFRGWMTDEQYASSPNPPEMVQDEA